jgi:spore coat polysaccharide biosynthesis protein SpsF
VRLGSERLPNKALLPLKGGVVIEHAMRALKRVPAAVHALLTDDASADRLARCAEREDFRLYKGPTEDVLKRYCLAAEFYEVTRVVRATGDNPLVSAALAEALLKQHARRKLQLSHFVGMPLGTGVEAVETEALLRADDQSRCAYEREHLTTYIYRNADHFRIAHLPCPSDCYLPAARVTLDTESDYRLISRIFDDLYQGEPVAVEAIVGWFKKNRDLCRSTVRV